MPIIGELREIFIVLEIIIVLLSLEFGIIFLNKYIQNRKNQKFTRIELSWSIIFFAFGFMMFFYQFSDFYYVNRQYYLFLAYLSITTGALVLVSNSEKIGIINTKWIIPVLCLFLWIGFIFSYFLDPALPQLISNIALIPFTFFVFLYIYHMFKYLKGKFRLYTIGLFFGISLLFVGMLGQSDIAANLFGLGIRIYADLFIILGISSLAIFFSLIPSLSEIEWYDKLKFILVTTKNGICLYDENFIEKQRIDDDLLAASMTIIQQLLIEMTKGGQELRTLAKENEYFLLEYGEKVVGILITTEELQSLKILLKEFIKKFEDFYRDTFTLWDGDVTIFRPTSFMISKIFKRLQ